MEMQNVPTLMTVEEVAAYLRVNTITVRRLLKRGEMPATRVGRQWRFNRDLVDKWFTDRTIGGRLSILVVDDETTIQALFEDTLRELGHNVASAGSGSRALELLQQQDFDLVFLDLKMPGMDGAELFRHIKTIRPNLPVIVITGYPDSDMMARALAHGPFGVMNKPFGESDITKAIANFLRIAR